ncbi:MAG: outer membrane lipoprotein-sorting protein [Bacteroidetes bacterium]|nr:outer membrane lipoprotein-sorting protein [Bacteroidota bacterium]
MKKFKAILIVFIALAMVLTSNAQSGLTAKQIQQKSIEVTRVKGTEAISKMTIINQNGQERVRQIAVITKLYDNGNTEKKLIRFSAPADVKGVGFLTYDYNTKDDDKWIYMPALRKTRRIISSESAKSFMGSEFSYADMTLPNIDEYSYKLLGVESVKDISCYKIEITPINEDVMDANGFSKKVTFIGKSDFVLRKAVYYDLFEDKEKVMEVESIIEVDKTSHKYRFGKIVMINIQNGRKSISQIEKIQFNPNIPDDYFTTRYLER